MADAEDPKSQKNGWRVRPSEVGGTALGFFAGMLTHRAAGGIPTETLEWIIKNGSAGFFLVGLMVVGWAYVQERRERTREAFRHAEKIENLLGRIETNEGRHALKVESVMRENAPLTRKMTQVMAILIEVMRDRTKFSSELRELTDATPDEPIKLPRREGETGQEETE